MAEPRAEYQTRLAERQAAWARAKKLDDYFVRARGTLFVVCLVFAALIFSPLAFPAWTLVLPAVALVILIAIHGSVIERKNRLARGVAYYEAGLARLDDRWSGVGHDGIRYRDSAHPYSDDLDLFGPGSLFQLISRARTRVGEDTLARWLREPADVATVRARQEAVSELREALDLRESMALLDAKIHDDLDQNRLERWALDKPSPIPLTVRAVAIVLAVTALAMAAGWLLLNWHLLWLLLALTGLAMVLFSCRRQIHQLVQTVDAADFGLAILAQVLSLLETQSFRTALLAELRGRLQTDGLPPSRHIARLHGLIGWLNNCTRNQLFAPLALLLCLPVHLVHAIEIWRAGVGKHIPDWLEAVGQFEALLSFAGYAWEHPRDVFPELDASGPVFAARELGHPLLPADKCIRNDVALEGALQLILVSGSNMSGKSTLLRSVGVNAVLAQAGAPVCAARLQLSPLQPATAMRIHDSLQEGVSLFYASLGRLKLVLSLTQQPRRVLFLLDEILQGTNSHDRRLGAEGVIRKLLADNAAGFVTTHDLALTDIVEMFGANAVNVHFEDRIEDGRMVFDYRLRPGIVGRSNALELMRMMGLDV